MRNACSAVMLTMLFPAAGCAGAKATPASAAAPTRYRVGDAVEYRYEGTFSAQPVTLVERIEKQDGNVLRIMVTARRGGDTLEWAQTVTDTPENQKAEKVDALQVKKDGAWVEVPPTREEVYRLYAWTLPPVDGAPADVTRATVTETVGGVTYTCTAEQGRFVNAEKNTRVRFHFATCPAFLWTNASARLEDEQTGAIIWARTVTSVTPAR